MSNVVVVRSIVSCMALVSILGCGSGPGSLGEIQQLSPSRIGARSPTFTLYVYGNGFTPQSRVVFGDVELDLVSHSATILVAQVPGGTAGTSASGEVPVSVKNPDGTRSNEVSLVVSEAAAPILLEVDSNLCNGNGPLRVTLVGDNFTVDTIVEVDGQPASISQLSSSALSFKTALKYGEYSFKVTVPPPGGGEATIDYPTFLGCD